MHTSYAVVEAQQRKTWSGFRTSLECPEETQQKKNNPKKTHMDVAPLWMWFWIKNVRGRTDDYNFPTLSLIFTLTEPQIVKK